MSETVDFVIAGGGHNSLITATYLARAGYECLVLDARSIPGGGAASEELLGPGYSFDSCSTGHTLIQANPLLADDELGLLSDYGLTYDMPDPIAHVVLPDGSSFTSWLDLDRTVEEFAKHSRADAETYRRMITDYGEISGLLRDANFTPPGYGTPLPVALEAHPRAGRWLRRRMMTAADVIDREFENRHVKAYLAWQAFQTAQPIDAGGTGMLAISIQAGRQKRSWTIPRGGSGSLTAALVRAFEDLGGVVVCDTTVTELVLEGDRCVGVRTASGEVYRAREGVVSTIHVKHLTEMAPTEAWDDDWLYGISTYDLGLSAFAVYLATDAPRSSRPGTRRSRPSRPAPWAGSRTSCSTAATSRTASSSPGVPWLLVATPTLVDPSRAPEGHHTVKLLSMQRPDPTDGRPWEEVKEEHARPAAGARTPAGAQPRRGARARPVGEEPRDIEKGNPHMVDGSSTGASAASPRSVRCAPRPAGGSTECRSAGSTRQEPRRTPAARSPAPRAATPPRSSSTTGGEAWPTSSRHERERDPMPTHASPPRSSTGRPGSSRTGSTTTTSSRPRPGSRRGRTGSRSGAGPPRGTSAGRRSARRANGPERRSRLAPGGGVPPLREVRVDGRPGPRSRGRRPRGRRDVPRPRPPRPDRRTGRRTAGRRRRSWRTCDGLPGWRGHRSSVLVPGLDSTKEEFFWLEQSFLDRGMATVSLDGPGQGETRGRAAGAPRLRGRGLGAARRAHGPRGPGPRPDGLYGVSLGGYYAPARDGARAADPGHGGHGRSLPLG